MQAWPAASRRDRSHGVSDLVWARIALSLSVAGAEVDVVGFLMGAGEGGGKALGGAG